MKKFDHYRFYFPQQVEKFHFQRHYSEVCQGSHLMYLMVTFENLRFYLKSSQKRYFEGDCQPYFVSIYFINLNCPFMPVESQIKILQW